MIFGATYFFANLLNISKNKHLKWTSSLCLNARVRKRIRRPIPHQRLWTLFRRVAKRIHQDYKLPMIRVSAYQSINKTKLLECSQDCISSKCQYLVSSMRISSSIRNNSLHSKTNTFSRCKTSSNRALVSLRTWTDRKWWMSRRWATTFRKLRVFTRTLCRHNSKWTLNSKTFQILST